MVKAGPAPSGRVYRFAPMIPGSENRKPRRVAGMRAVVWTAVALLSLAAIGATAVYRRGTADDAFYAQWGVENPPGSPQMGAFSRALSLTIL